MPIKFFLARFIHHCGVLCAEWGEKKPCMSHLASLNFISALPELVEELDC